MVAFVMPKLGADMTAGKLVAWCKQPGETVERGEIIAVIETDKVNVDAESFVTGVLERILVEPHDEWLPVGTPLAEIRVAEGTAAQPAGSGPPPPSPASPTPVMAAATSPAPSAPAGITGGSRFGAAPAASTAERELERLRISPAARKRVLDLGLDPKELKGSGPGGRITLEDVDRLAAMAALPTIAPSDRQQRMRDAIAAAMTRAKREIPHYYLAATIDMASALAWLDARNRERPVTERLLHGALLLKATALALREVPELNGFWRDGRIETSDAIHVGVAISLRGGGLVAPAVHDADRLSLDELMQKLKDLTQRARALSLKSSEMTDPTITVTSLGERGAEAVFGIIYPPQLALVGFGRIVERPWVVAGSVVPRPLLTATLAGDHRATDGHRGGLLLDAIDRLLQEPGRL